MGNKLSNKSLEKEQTIFKSDLDKIKYSENLYPFCEPFNSQNLLKVLSEVNKHETNKITDDIPTFNNHDQSNLSDKNKFILKLKFLLMCQYINTKPLKFNFNNIKNEHIEYYVRGYNFNKHIKEIELLMPNKLIKNIEIPSVYQLKMEQQLNKNKETKKKLNQLIVKYFKLRKAVD
jgi:hypothetical protein